MSQSLTLSKLYLIKHYPHHQTKVRIGQLLTKEIYHYLILKGVNQGALLIGMKIK